MHLIMILTTVTIAWYLRCSWHLPQGSWHLRWRRTLFLFLFPPLLMFMTAISVLYMGTQGTMGGMSTDYLGYVLALIYLIFFAILCIKLSLDGWKSVKSTCSCPQINLAGRQVRLLPTESLFAGQIGFWQPELVISQGLVQNLSPTHLESVLAHEQGHYHYRDTFWFFWLGWVRACTAWLPNTELLWEELLVLRELRADSYAASQVDPLVLAESLLLVVTNSYIIPEICCAALGSPSICDERSPAGGSRIQQRIEALITPSEPIIETQIQSWHSFILAFLPLVTVIFHR